MKLIDLFESDTVQKILDAKKAYDKYVGRFGMGDPARVPPQYRGEMDKLKNAWKAFQEERKSEREHQAASPNLLAAKHYLSTRNDNPEEVKQRLGASIGSGLKTSNELRRELGDYIGIANDIKANLNKLTNNKTMPLDMEAIERRYGFPMRTIHKWFEKPEFSDLRPFMPSQFKQFRR